LQAARRLPEVRFVFTWRKKNYAKLRELIDESGLKNVEVKNGFIPNMGEVYQSVHATILPGLTSGSLKPTPHSALDSLSYGKPVLVSRPSSIAKMVEQNHCGIVFDPSIDQLVQAINHLKENYDQYQSNCHPTIQNCFSDKFFIESYREIYAEMLAEPEAG
jgi:glycosyltransferase involved in cell wall biosynthesis